RALQLHRPAAEELLGGVAGLRIRLLGQRQSSGLAPALEPGDRGADRAGRAPADALVQRLWRLRPRPVQGPREGAARGVVPIRRPYPGDGLGRGWISAMIQ